MRSSWLAAVGVVTILAGCSATTAGAPYPDGSPRPVADYRAEMSSAQRDALQYLDSIRDRDPCALLDEAAIGGIGGAEFFGPGDTVASCEVSFDPPAGPAAITGVSVETDVVPVQARPVTPAHPIAGYPTEVSRVGNSCAATVSVGDAVVVNYTMWHDNPVDVCSDLTAVLEASLPSLASRPSRTDSRRWRATTLDTLDPCGFLATVEFEESPTVQGEPSGCRYTIGRGRDSSTVEVSFGYSPSDTFVQSGVDVALLVAGIPAVESARAPLCRIDLGVGDDHPIPDRYGGDRVESVKIFGTSCDAMRDIAVEVAHQYQAAQ